MSKKLTLIGITGLKGSGKTTACEQLVVKHNFKILSFAAALKQMLITLGLTEDEVYGKLKEQESLLLCGKTPRFAMQTLGTEWGRKMFGEDIWVNAWESRLQRTALMGLAAHVLVDDLRFPNEHQRIKHLGGVTIRIRCPWAEAKHTDLHESEAHAMSLPVDHEIYNDEWGNPGKLCQALDGIINGLLPASQ